jgi:hypothetical protein
MSLCDISTPTDTGQPIYSLYIERSSAHLTVAMDCTVSFSARSNKKDADLWKRRAIEFHLIAAQKFLSELTELSAWNLDHGVCVTKLRAIASTNILKVSHWYVTKDTFLFHAIHSLSTETFVFTSSSSAFSWNFYARMPIHRNTNLLHVRPSVHMCQSDFHWRDLHAILCLVRAWKYF